MELIRTGAHRIHVHGAHPSQQRLFAVFMTVLALLGSAVGMAQEKPVYFTSFDAPDRPDRYLRNLYAMDRMEVADNPTGVGNRVLKIQIRFTEKHKRATLLFDLAPIRFSRFRVRIWNPNPPDHAILLRSIVGGSEGESWIMRAWGASSGPQAKATPLPESRQAGWITYECSLAKNTIKRTGKTDEADPATLTHLYLTFEPQGAPPPSSVPLTFYLEGLECF